MNFQKLSLLNNVLTHLTYHYIMNESDKIQENISPEISQEEESQTDSLETILARPGVAEVMKIYNHWQEYNKIVETHRSILDVPGRIITSDSSNV